MPIQKVCRSNKELQMAEANNKRREKQTSSGRRPNGVAGFGVDAADHLNGSLQESGALICTLNSRTPILSRPRKRTPNFWKQSWKSCITTPARRS